ncbi:MAG: helix-turn-helix transcriptional regulator [Actinomycetota bacterium]
MTRGSELGRTVRRRRLELGMSQSRVADAVGVSPLQVGRWERGEGIPDPSRVRALADALELGPDTVQSWLAAAEAQVLSIEIVGEPLAPPLVIMESGDEGDPWSAPPEKRIAPPRLDRAALIGKGNGHGGGRVSTTAVVPVTTAAPDATIERLLRRQARGDERRLRRQMLASHRVERAQVAADTRHHQAEASLAARRGPLWMPPQADRSAPPPAGAANTGSVFPVPDTKKGSERVTYEGVGETSAQRDRLTYVFRMIGTIVALVILAGLLWWAMGSLGDGLRSILDLLKGGEDSLPAPEVVGLILSG